MDGGLNVKPTFYVIALGVFLSVIQISAAQDRPMKPTNAPKINNAALDKLGWKLGCQAYTFREMSACETLEVLKNLGIHYVEFYPGQKFSKNQPNVKLDHHLTSERIEELQEKLKECDVTAINYGVVELPNDESKAREVFDFARRLGLKTI